MHPLVQDEFSADLGLTQDQVRSGVVEFQVIVVDSVDQLSDAKLKIVCNNQKVLGAQVKEVPLHYKVPLHYTPIYLQIWVDYRQALDQSR